MGMPSTAAPKVLSVPDEKSELARIAAQLEDLKRLAIMQLLVSGAQSAHIAKALKIDPSTISRMMPVREIQKRAGKRSQETE
jgi:IS30 family transposase